MNPFKDKQTAKEYWREKKRQQRMSNPNPNVQPSSENRIVQPKVMPSGGRITPTLLNFLTDKVKRQKLERLVEALSRRDLGGEVRFGVAGVTFREIEELLETTA